MITIKQTTHIPEENYIHAHMCYEETVLSEEIKEALSRKPKSKIIEHFPSKEGGRHLLCRMGFSKKSDNRFREELGSLLLSLSEEGGEKALLLDLREDKTAELSLSLLFGLLLTSKALHPFHFVKERNTLSMIYLLTSGQSASFTLTLKRYEAIIEGILYARCLTEAPPNLLYPEAFAEKIKELEALNIEVIVLKKEELQKIGMEALLSVSLGSESPPCVAILKWRGSLEENPYVFVGKGVCFDSGGLCLKKQNEQLLMKFDKAGAGAVAGFLKTAALQNCPHPLIGVLGLVENMPGGAALKPGSVISSLSKKTIEVVDTDAEGRLVLADCLFYAEHLFKPKAIIDLATLTVDTIASLGTMYGALYSKNRELADSLLEASRISHDLLWELPMGSFFLEEIQSDYADLKNSGINLCGENGSAAEFLHSFVSEKTPFAHLDIGGVCFGTKATPLCPIGATGFGVRLLEEWLRTKF